MNTSLENMSINRIVIHQVYKRENDGSIKKPYYNNSLTNLDNTGKFVFTQRIMQSIGSDSHSVEMNIYKNNANTTFNYVTKCINAKDNKEFIKISQDIAYNLAEAQNTKRIPGGIIVIFDGTIGVTNNTFIGIMKAEIQEGFKLNDSSGLQLDFIENLILTPQQKLYKTALFIKSLTNNNNMDDFNVFIYDSNLGSGINSEAAKYFYDGFLGCKFKENNKFLTKQFYVDTKKFINDLQELSDTDKIDLSNALYTYIKTENSNLISTKEFSDKYLKEEIKNCYTQYMEQNQFPSNNIGKDTILIKSAIKNRNIKFSNDIKLIVPSDKFKDTVEITETEDNNINIKINGKIISQD